MAKILLVDDDDAFRFATAKAVEALGHRTEEARDGETALGILARAAPPDVVLLDMEMERTGGLEVLRRRPPGFAQFIMLTGHASVPAAVEAMRLGALSFLEKPVNRAVLEPLLKQAVLEAQRQQPGAGQQLAPPLIGASAAMQEVKEFIRRVGPTAETVAVAGETGTGKEVVSRHLHVASERASGPFVALNAACVPKELFESELFGHRKGAFTGATSDRLGLFREAGGGTLFIDEVGELPLESQAKLLRSLETKTIRVVGENREISIDVRIVVATNRDLWQEVQRGRFREDLYFRLHVFPVRIPPLRERPQDLLPLSIELLGRLGNPGLQLAADAQPALAAYDWPGNVRELFNVLRRSALFAHHDRVDAALITKMIAASIFRRAPNDTTPIVLETVSDPPGSGPLRGSLAEVEQAHIRQVLLEVDGNITRAAIALGIDRRTLQRKLKAYGIVHDRS